MIFTYIEKITTKLTESITTAAISPQVNALQSILLAYITVWVMAKGYMILAGKSQEPFKDILYDAAIKAIIITVVFSPAWLNLVTSTIDGLNEWASGGVSLYGRLDTMYQQVIDMGVMMENRDSTWEFTGLFCQFGVVIAFAIVALLSIGIIIVASFTLKILIMIAPLMIFTLMFDWFKSIFERWLQLVLNNTLTVLFIGVTFNILSDEYETIINKLLSDTANRSSDMVAITSDLFFTSIIIAVLILMARSMAQQLTHVSIENLPVSAVSTAYNFLNRQGRRISSLPRYRRTQRR